MTVSRRAFLGDIATYVAYFVICLFFAGPLLWLVSLSIRSAPPPKSNDDPWVMIRSVNTTCVTAGGGETNTWKIRS